MLVRVVAFARIRELVGAAALERSVADGATVGVLWSALANEFPALGNLAGATRFVRNGAFVAAGERLCDGDELALLPPFGGG